jgi:hypothetical protein
VADRSRRIQSRTDLHSAFRAGRMGRLRPIRISGRKIAAALFCNRRFFPVQPPLLGDSLDVPAALGRVGVRRGARHRCRSGRDDHGGFGRRPRCASVWRPASSRPGVHGRRRLGLLVGWAGGTRSAVRVRELLAARCWSPSRCGDDLLRSYGHCQLADAVMGLRSGGAAGSSHRAVRPFEFRLRC